MKPRYAARTRVTPEASVAEIRAVVRRYGATAFAQSEDEERASVAFVIGGLRIRMSLDLPASASAQETRSRFRALTIVVKAKLEAVALGISTIEDEFMSSVIMPDGKTVGEHVRPQIAIAYQTGVTPQLLAGPDARP